VNGKALDEREERLLRPCGRPPVQRLLTGIESCCKGRGGRLGKHHKPKRRSVRFSQSLPRGAAEVRGKKGGGGEIEGKREPT